MDTRRLAAPLPRAPQWLDGSAFHSHGDLMQKVFGLPPIEDKLEVPLMYQGEPTISSVRTTTCRYPARRMASTSKRNSRWWPIASRWGRRRHALQRIKLLMLVNDASLRRWRLAR